MFIIRNSSSQGFPLCCTLYTNVLYINMDQPTNLRARILSCPAETSVCCKKTKPATCFSRRVTFCLFLSLSLVFFPSLLSLSVFLFLPFIYFNSHSYHFLLHPLTMMPSPPSSPTVPASKMDPEVMERLTRMQLADLGSRRREHISTVEGRGPRATTHIQDIEAKRWTHQQGSAAQRLAAENVSKLDRWNSKPPFPPSPRGKTNTRDRRTSDHRRHPGHGTS